MWGIDSYWLVQRFLFPREEEERDSHHSCGIYNFGCASSLKVFSKGSKKHLKKVKMRDCNQSTQMLPTRFGDGHIFGEREYEVKYKGN